MYQLRRGMGRLLPVMVVRAIARPPVTGHLPSMTDQEAADQLHAALASRRAGRSPPGAGRPDESPMYRADPSRDETHALDADRPRHDRRRAAPALGRPRPRPLLAAGAAHLP